MAYHHAVTGTEAASGTPQRGSLADGVRRLAYASLGLFSVMSDEVGAFYEKCVTRGVICQGILIQLLSANSSTDCRQGDPPLVGKQLHRLSAR
jgi:hypothetical protein